MKDFSRRSLLSVLGSVLPFGLGARARASATGPAIDGPALRFVPFEEAVRAAFADGGRSSPRRRIEVGGFGLVRAGVQGCHNDRPFAGFPAGRLRIVRTASAPGPARHGVRLYVTTVDVERADGPTPGVASRPLDFASLPPAPTFS